MSLFLPSRRQMLRHSAGGLGSLALAGMLGWDPEAELRAEGGLPAPAELPALAASLIYTGWVVLPQLLMGGALALLGLRRPPAPRSPPAPG